MIPFNRPGYLGSEINYINKAIQNNRLCGDGEFNLKCKKWFEDKTGSRQVLMTTSCTHALEMAAILIDIKEGDEIIMPSFTFVSTANAFVMRGAKIVFIDIRPDTMNLNENLIEQAITKKTKAIVAVHYAGVACEMDEILKIAVKYNIYVIEDAAQGVMATYKKRQLGSIGDIGAYSFHETKNYNCGEGGAVLMNNEKFIERAEIIREKGTDRTKFFRGEVDKYSWVDIGSSYLPSELNAAYLFAQLETADEINKNRIQTWEKYRTGFKKLKNEGYIDWQIVPEYCGHNAHMFYIKLKDLNERTSFAKYMKEKGVLAIFHYVPLHSSKAGMKYGEFIGEDKFTTIESERLIRLPLYYNMESQDVEYIIENAISFFKI